MADWAAGSTFLWEKQLARNEYVSSGEKAAPKAGQEVWRTPVLSHAKPWEFKTCRMFHDGKWRLCPRNLRTRYGITFKSHKPSQKSPALVPLIPAATVCTRSRHQELTVPFLIVLLKMSSRHHEYKYCSYSHTKKAIQIKQLNTKIRWNTWTPQWNSEH